MTTAPLSLQVDPQEVRALLRLAKELTRNETGSEDPVLVSVVMRALLQTKET